MNKYSILVVISIIFPVYSLPCFFTLCSGKYPLLQEIREDSVIRPDVTKLDYNATMNISKILLLSSDSKISSDQAAQVVNEIYKRYHSYSKKYMIQGFCGADQNVEVYIALKSAKRAEVVIKNKHTEIFYGAIRLLQAQNY